MTAARERVSIATQLTIPHRGSCLVPDYRGAVQLPREAGEGSSPSHGRGWAILAPGLRLGQVPARLPANPRFPRQLVFCTHIPSQWCGSGAQKEPALAPQATNSFLCSPVLCSASFFLSCCWLVRKTSTCLPVSTHVPCCGGLPRGGASPAHQGEILGIPEERGSFDAKSGCLP